MKDIKEKAVEYGTTNIQQIDAIDRFINKALAKQKEEILDRLPKEKIKMKKPHLTADCNVENHISYHTFCSGNCQCWCHINDFNQALSQIKDIIKES